MKSFQFSWTDPLHPLQTFDKKMNFSDLVRQERDRYFICLKESLADHRIQHPKAVAEVLIEMNSDKFSWPYKLIRPDILYTKDDGQPAMVEVNQDSYLSFSEHHFTIAPDIPATATPFHWNGIEFRFYGHPLSFDPLLPWIDYWLDPEDKRYVENVDFLGVIHSITAPSCEGSYWELSIDFGSADIEALFQLFGIFTQIGVTKVEMGSFSMIETEDGRTSASSQ